MALHTVAVQGQELSVGAVGRLSEGEDHFVVGGFEAGFFEGFAGFGVFVGDHEEIGRAHV